MLTDVLCRTAKPTSNLRKLSDGGGLQLWVNPGGSKLWRFAYRFGGKQKLLALGGYPLVTLASARLARDAAKRLLIDGVDPASARKEQRAAQVAQAQTFKSIAGEYIAKLRQQLLSENTISKNDWLLSFAYPTIGDRPIIDVKPADVLQILRKVEGRGRFHTAHRLRSTIGAVFRFAIATDRAEADPTIALRDALVSYKQKRRPAITNEKAFGALLRAIDGYDGHVVTRIALQLCALLFPRPGELRQARWVEFDLDAAIWTVPAERMKGRVEHYVPLPQQALELLRELREINASGDLAFKSIGSARRPLSDGALNSALRRLGYDTRAEHCAHGFRSTASTLLNESGKFHPDAIERQLAHIDRDDVRGAYARGAFWDERVLLMQYWADRCDRARELGQVIKLTA